MKAFELGTLINLKMKLMQQEKCCKGKARLKMLGFTKTPQNNFQHTFLNSY